MTDSEVSRYVLAFVNEVMLQGSEPGWARGAFYREGDPLSGDLFFLPKQPGLKGEDVVEHPFDPPAFQPVIGDEPACAQYVAQLVCQRPVNSRSPLGQRILQYLQASVECPHPRSFGGASKGRHVPKTSSRPS